MSTNFKAIITNARVSSEMTYTPGYTKQGGGKVQARVVVPFMVTDPSYTNEEGERVDGKTESGQLTAWGASADVCAKYLKLGKEFSCEARINAYKSRIVDSDTKKAILNSSGQEAKSNKHSFSLIPGSLRFGEDSADCVNKELGNGLRPVGYDGNVPINVIESAIARNDLPGMLAQAKQGSAAWKAIRENLKALRFTPGMTYFGNAKVIAPTGAENQTNPALTAAVAQATAPVTVDGHSYADMKAVGWTDAQLLTEHGGKYACLVPGAAPAPPVPPMGVAV